jgi:hypothetical protein
VDDLGGGCCSQIQFQAVALNRLSMCGTSNERHLVPSPCKHGTVKAAYGACTHNGNVFKSGNAQDEPSFASKIKADF